MQKTSDELNKTQCLSLTTSQPSDTRTKTTSDNLLRTEIWRWLSPPDPSINHNTACEAQHSGTASWFFEGAIYNEWMATGPLLWIHGNRTGFSLVSLVPPL